MSTTAIIPEEAGPIQADAQQLADVKVPIAWRDPIVSIVMAALTVLLAISSKGISNISFSGASGWFRGGVWTLNAPLATWILAAVGIAATIAVWVKATNRKTVEGWLVVIVGAAFILAFLVCKEPTATRLLSWGRSRRNESMSSLRTAQSWRKQSACHLNCMNT